MPKEKINIIMDNDYPFDETKQLFERTQSIQLKKVIHYDSESRFIIKQKIRILKSLGFHNLIGIESIISDENAITLFFQCIPYQFLKEIGTLCEQKITKIYSQILGLCECLASRCIVHDLNVNRVGLDKRFNLKYYLGVDFKIDKGIDKNQRLQAYKSQIGRYFTNNYRKQIKFIDKIEQFNHYCERRTENFNKINQNQSKFQNNVKKLSNFQLNMQRRILKKSNILDSKSQQMNARKYLNRFRFNNDKCIQLTINEKFNDILQKNQYNKPIKIEDLTIRINRLKCYMKQVTGKIHRNNVSLINGEKIVPNRNHLSSQFNSKEQQSSSYSSYNIKISIPNKISKQQKKVGYFRTSMLDLTINTNMQSSKKVNNQSKDQIDDKLKISQTNNFQQINKQIKNEIFNNQDESFKKNVLNFSQEDRQHKQYLTLATNDKYCEQFMNFLQDNNETSLKKSIQELKQEETIRISSPFLHPQDSPRKKNVHLRQNLKTQSSENTLEIQNRVQKVIRSSLRLINGLRSRQTIRCQ